MLNLVKSFIFLWLCLFSQLNYAGLFDDDEARQAILDLRAKTDATNTRIDTLSRNVLNLHNEIQKLLESIAVLRGESEALSNELAQLQQVQNEEFTKINQRLLVLEPQKVNINGQEGLLQPGEQEKFKVALKIFQEGDFKKAAGYFGAYIRDYPNSPYQAEARYWLGSALYAQRDYPAALAVLESVVSNYPKASKMPEVLMMIATSQLESGQKDLSKKTLNKVISQYPNTEIAHTAKTQLSKIDTSKTNAKPRDH